jgi:ubiquitin-activating enzyme E1
MSLYVQDEHRYSRQSYTLGKDIMIKLSEANVLVIGYGVLGQEIIKNLALLGINCINIVNKKSLTNYQKTGLYYSIDNGFPIEQLRKLNPTIQINEVNVFNEDNEFDTNKIKKYNLVIITNTTYDDAQELNRICRKFSIPFIMSGCYGLMGYVFNDFGDSNDEFIVHDIDGEVYENLLVSKIDDDIITFKDKHNLGDGDTLIFTIDTSEILEIKVKSTISPLKIRVKFDNVFSLQKENIISVIKKKIPVTFEFKMLKNNYNNIDAVTSDFSVDFNRPHELHELHKTYDKFLEATGETPRSWSLIDFELFSSYIKEFEKKSKDFITLAKKFCYTLRGSFLPFASIIAAVVSQESLKALGHKYIPITQWYYLDYLEIISDDEVNLFDDNRAINYRSNDNDKYEGIINIFGKKLYEKIKNTSPFIIGSGAIGCELIKNLGMMGTNIMIVADPDYIEKSNLSRQFLFNDGDIRKSKAQTAADKIKLFNSDTNVIVFEQKVSGETETIFNNEFHQNVDIYLNALDNVDARIYMDEQAIKYSKPLIDSGTMGAKGNVQVVIPYLTESYGSSKDPDEKSGIPICTIKSFPYKPEHTIQWARELFETEFNLIPSLIHKYSDVEKLTTTNDGDIKIFFRQIYKYKNFKTDEQGYFNILSTIFYENFYENIIQIINKYSKPENIEELGDKKLPEILEFTEELFDNFMLYGFKILNQMFNTNINWVTTKVIHTFLNPNPNIFTLDIEKILVEEAFNLIVQILSTFPHVLKVDFEKDDDELGHVQFITECANIRNQQYSIPKSDIYQTRKIAGNIIPAMITTTALIAGFQILEYIKVIKNYTRDKHKSIQYDSDIDIYKNRFVNLNINYIDGINPGKPDRTIIGNTTISVWSKIDVNSDMAKNVIEQINLITQNKVEYITCGSETIYDGDDILIEQINFKEKVLALIMIGDKPIELKINLFN